MDMTWKRSILLSLRNSKETTKTIPSKSKFTEIPPSFNLALSLMPAGWQNTSEGCKTSACGPDTAAISGIESNKTNRLGAPLHSTVKFQDFQRLTNSLCTDFPRVHILLDRTITVTHNSYILPDPLLQIQVTAKTKITSSSPDLCQHGPMRSLPTGQHSALLPSTHSQTLFGSGLFIYCTFSSCNPEARIISPYE